ncbi:MAG: serine/threonine protein kinase [Candidatus Tectimicrobiota bacterium]
MDDAGVASTDTVAQMSDTGPLMELEELEPGTMVAQRYRVIRQIHRDSVGLAMLVEDTIWGEEIVLKFLHPTVTANALHLKGFIQELRLARKVIHENVMRMHDVLVFDNVYALSLEHFPSHALSEELKHGPLTVTRGLRISWDLCRGLNAIHQAGLVQRALTPEHILLNYAGGVKIVGEFLPMNAVENKTVHEAALLRAPRYTAPECVRQCAMDARTNVYTLGVIMYEMFTGHHPYPGDNATALLVQHVEGHPAPPRQLQATLPAELEAIILHAMAVDPAQRFQTTDSLRRSMVALFKQPGSA